MEVAAEANNARNIDLPINKKITMASFLHLLLASAILALLAPTSNAALSNNILYGGIEIGNILHAGQSLTNGPFRLGMTRSCNLELHDGHELVWSKVTGVNYDEDCYLQLKNHGNLAIYKSNNAIAAIIFENKEIRPEQHSVLVLQNDRNVVLYGPACWSTGTYPRLWSTGTISRADAEQASFVRFENNVLYGLKTAKDPIRGVPASILPAGQSLTNADFRLTLTHQCDLDFYDGSSLVWSYATHVNDPSCYLKVQDNGSLTIFTKDHKIAYKIFESNDAKNKYSVLVIQNDRNVVLYGPDLWGTSTSIEPGTLNTILTGNRKTMKLPA